MPDFDEDNTNHIINHSEAKVVIGARALLEKVDFKKISLEFKGVQEKAYLLHLYLLDFDRQQPFPVQVSKKDSKEPITFGGHQFKIVSGSDRFIKLKLIDSYQTP
jgi:hypothetical protein